MYKTQNFYKILIFVILLITSRKNIFDKQFCIVPRQRSQLRTSYPLYTQNILVTHALEVS